jgi:hypothetical protein
MCFSDLIVIIMTKTNKPLPAPAPVADLPAKTLFILTAVNFFTVAGGAVFAAADELVDIADDNV